MMFSSCMVLEGAWISTCFRLTVLELIIPTSVIVLAIVYDIFRNIRFPKLVDNVLQVLASPFRNFLHFEDLEEADFPQPKLTPPLWKFRLLALLPLIEAIGYALASVYEQSISRYEDGARLLVICAGWLYASIKTYWAVPTTPMYLSLLFYIMHATSALVNLISDVRDSSPKSMALVLDFLHLVPPVLLTCVMGTLPVRDIVPGPAVASDKDIPSSAFTCPEDKVTLWQWCNFSFVEPILELANARRLDDADVWRLSPYFKHKNTFRGQLDYINRNPSHSLLRFLLASNSLDLILDMVLELWIAVVVFLPPYALQRILTALADPTPESKLDAHIFAFITFIAHLSFAQVALFKCWHGRRSYERTRGQLFCALNYKALKRRDLSGKVSNEDDAASNADLGKVLNLMQGDTYAVAGVFWEFTKPFTTLVRIVIAMVFLYNVLGWSSLAGVTVVVIAYVVNYPLAKYNVFITRASWRAKDTRMTAVNELFQNIRFLKFYGWENHWAGKVRDYREKELNWRVKANIVDTVTSFIWTWVPSATALFSFLCYTLVAGERLTVAKAFTSLALFSQLQGPMTSLPQQFFSFLHAYVSLQRIQKFLAEDEVDDWASSLKNPSMNVRNEKIGFSRGVFEWDAPPREPNSVKRFRLGPLDVDFPIGQLSIVTGATGSGKTALLVALLGEMYSVDGIVHLSKSNNQVAYCAQNPWLQHATIRDNIVFDSSLGYDEARYAAVIEACALERDMAMFDAGDQTEIGEKGVTLSGGQRARVALARAVYSEASCLLLDDPLAAVDMHTAQHLVINCFQGKIMRGRTIILVTHHLTLCLSAAAFILELSDGKILRQGSVTELQALGQLKTVIQAEETDEERNVDADELHTMPNEADEVELDTQPKRLASSGKLVEIEARAEGRVSLHTYLTYVRGAGWIAWIFIIVFMLLIKLIDIGNNLFLAKWGQAYEKGYKLLIQSVTILEQSLFSGQLPSPEVDPEIWLLIYLWISLAGAFSVLAYISLGYYASLQASRSLFTSMLLRLTRAPSRFFDVTPMGRLLNRFTADMNTVDDRLQQSARAALSGSLAFLASFLFIVWVIPQFGPFALMIALLYIRLAPRYIRTSRDLRRLESVALSPTFAGFDELLRGLSHVRAFAMEEKFQDKFYQRVDTFQTCDHHYWLVSGWLQWRYDCLGSLVVYMSTLFALLTGIADDFAALVIIQAGIFAEASRQLVRVAAQLELDFNSVERIGEYLEVPQEAPATINEKRPPAYWPSSNGQLVVENLVVCYAPDLPAVLNGLSFTVNPGEKIGVVGRTGSGKSTLAMSLLRIIEPSAGKIILDGIDVSTIGLDDLRSKITIVSQDVSLFTGTIRSNIDPFDEHSDHECWDVLRRCNLIANDSGTQLGRITSLDTAISPSGTLSAGERQLVALARAILRRTQFIILDEATSQIDTLLDDQVQKTIRDELSSATIITIAHRLKTIIDYNRILVLGPGGVLLEFDTPQRLIDRSGGVFGYMCRHSADWDDLKKIIDSSR